MIIAVLENRAWPQMALLALFDDLRCPLAHFLAYFRLWANVKHTQLAISTVEHVEGGWDYAQII